MSDFEDIATKTLRAEFQWEYRIKNKQSRSCKDCGFCMLFIKEKNDSSGAKYGRNELGLWCYYKVLALPVKR
jgi:hypothetical protein